MAVENIALEKLLVWEYQTDEALLVPYSGAAKQQFSEDFLVEQYVRLLKDDLLSTIYPEGEMNLNQFMAYCLNKPMQILCKKTSDLGPFPVAGFGWLYDFSGPEGARMSKVGFAFYKEFWGTSLVRQLGSLLIRWWIEVCKVDVLYGTLLATNRLAVNFARKYGFRELTVLPKFYLVENRRIDGRLVCLDKEDFRPFRPSMAGRANGDGQRPEL